MNHFDLGTKVPVKKFLIDGPPEGYLCAVKIKFDYHCVSSWLKLGGGFLRSGAS
jgi:hypothetical protein